MGSRPSVWGWDSTRAGYAAFARGGYFPASVRAVEWAHGQALPACARTTGITSRQQDANLIGTFAGSHGSEPERFARSEPVLPTDADLAASVVRVRAMLTPEEVRRVDFTGRYD